MAGLLVGCGGGDERDPGGPPPTAMLSGTVREVGSQSVIAGATVMVGSNSATTTETGHFELLNVPVGSVNIIVTANRFESDTKNITVNAGVNTVDIFLTIRTFYSRGDILAFLPPGVSTFRGAIFFLPGFNNDSRPLVRGEASLPGCLDWCGAIRTELRQRAVLLAETHGLALFGMKHMPNDANTWDEMLAAVTNIAAQSGRPDLAQVPLLLVGHSAGGCLAYSFTRVHSDRVIGFMSGKGQCHAPSDAGPLGARSVPAYFFIGEDDLASRLENITTVFEENRALGALWAVAIELGTGHAVLLDVGLQITWMDAVLGMRLPDSAGAGALRPMTEASGWLGNRSTSAIAEYVCYNDNKLVASWLPSEQTARDWQALVGAGTQTVISC